MSSQPAGSIRSALGWSFAEGLGNKGLSLLIKIVLARLLVPEDFGVIGMASVFIVLLNILSEMGMTAALIQRRECDLRPAHWRTAFTLSMAMAVFGWCTICVLFSPLIAAFYNEPLLKLVLPVLGFSLIIDTLAITHRVRLQKALKFKRLSLVNLSATTVACIVAVVMAYQHMGVWALAGKTVVESLLRTVMLFVLEPSGTSLGFEKKAFRDIFSFSSYMALGRLVLFFTNNLDYLLIGKMLGSAALGIYTLAFTLTDTVRRQVMVTFSKVFFPVYANLQDDPKRTEAYYLKVVRINSMVIMPLMVLLALNADPLVPIIFGSKWTETVQPLRILALSVIVHAIGGTAASLIRGAGHARLMTGITVFRTFFITAPAIAIGAVLGGINGVAWSVLISKFIGRNITQYYIRKLFDIHDSTILRAVTPAMVSCGVVTLVHYFMLSVIFVEHSLVMIGLRLFVELFLFGLMLGVPFLSLVIPGRSVRFTDLLRWWKVPGSPAG